MKKPGPEFWTEQVARVMTSVTRDAALATEQKFWDDVFLTVLKVSTDKSASYKKAIEVARETADAAIAARSQSSGR